MFYDKITQAWNIYFLHFPINVITLEQVVSDKNNSSINKQTSEIF